jgi:hypothetical protein
MVAGPRSREAPGIQEEARAFLLEVFRQVGKTPLEEWFAPVSRGHRDDSEEVHEPPSEGDLAASPHIASA